MKVLDLFAGIGGFSLAAHWMGWETAAFVEKESFCQKVLAKNFAGVPIYGDIYEFDGKPFRGSVDVVCGGFPCQPFSQAGKQKGKDDERYLFPEMLRVIREVEPAWVVAENVRGLLSLGDGETYAEIISLLESEGFGVVTFCIPASAVDAPHRRDRLWIVAHASDADRGRLKRGVQCDGEPKFARSASFGDDSDGCVEVACNPDSLRSRRPEDGEGVDKGSDRDEAGAVEAGESAGSDRAWAGDAEALANAASEGLPLGGSPGIGELSAEGREGFHHRLEFNDSGVTADPDTRRPLDAKHGRICRKGMEQEQSTRDRRDGWQRNWPEVAARLCRVDAGLPDQLDEFGNDRRDNRVARLKALGNAVVPQVVFEIFKAIEHAEISKAE